MSFIIEYYLQYSIPILFLISIIFLFLLFTHIPLSFIIVVLYYYVYTTGLKTQSAITCSSGWMYFQDSNLGYKTNFLYIFQEGKMYCWLAENVHLLVCSVDFCA